MMRSPLSLFRFIVKGLGNAFGAGIAGDFLVDVVPDMARDVWNWWSSELPAEERRREVQIIAEASTEELARQIDLVMNEQARDLPEAIRSAVASYLASVPAAIRRSLRRPSDPSGTTVSQNLAPKCAEDLVRFLPAKLPRYAPGDEPLPGVDWKLEQLLGVGGFGEVWLARNPFLSSSPPVALKFCLDPTSAKVLRNEAQVIDAVMRGGQHPGIVALQNTYLRSEVPCLQYEYVHGGDLAGLIREWSSEPVPPGPERVTAVILKLADILGAAHLATPPIVHRDLKPANILMCTDEGGGRLIATCP